MSLAEVIAKFEEPSATRLFEEALRIAEAILFATREPLSAEVLAARLPKGVAAAEVLVALQALYRDRGVVLVEVAGKWAFRTAPDLARVLVREVEEPRKLSRAALETLSVIAYHQPVTRAEIEEIRGVSAHRGTLDVLLETGWVRMRGRRRAPGRPITWGTTEAFLDHFGLASLDDLPGLAELKGAGFLDAALPADFSIPTPAPGTGLAPDEDPLDEGDAFAALEPDQLDALEAEAEEPRPGAPGA